jgi:large subunit ribosomal protein L29
MPKKKLDEIRKLKPEDKRKRLAELREELAMVKSKGGRSDENFKAVRDLKREIARVLTLMREAGA